MSRYRVWWLFVLGLACLLPGSSQAQETPFRPPEQVAPVVIPAEWGTLRNVLPLSGNPSYYSLVFEDSGGNIRIVPLYLNLVGGTWYLTNKRDPAVIIKRAP
jgi:hypothetical protein